jgi:hypothetical protein
MLAQSGDAQRFDHAAHPALFDVDHAAGMQGQGRAGIVQDANRFIQAQWRAHLTLQHGMLDDIAVRQGLFDHGQLEGIECAPDRCVLEPAVAIGVGHPCQLWPGAAHGAHPFHILAFKIFSLTR